MTFIADYRKMAKPRAVEEWGDIYLIRPLGYLLVQVFRHTPLTPTMVSGLAVLAGWWTAWIYFLSDSSGGVPALALLAALVFLLHSALDSADGQLARLTGRTTQLGRIIDGFCDSLAFLAIYAAIAAGAWVRSPRYGFIVTLLALLGMYTHSLQSSLVEYQRSLYLMAVHGKMDLALSSPGGKGASRSDEGGLFAIFLRFLYRRYHRRQRVFLPTTARLEEQVTELHERHPERLTEVARVYEHHQRPMLRGWSLLASNSHKLGIALSAFIPVLSGSFWSGLGMGWYFFYDIGLTVVMVWLIRRQAFVDERTVQALSLPGGVR